MYYYVDTDGLVRLLDGDKIATLCAMFVMDLVKAAGVEIKVGVVQTAYANGNSTSYLSKVLVLPLLQCKELTGRGSQFLVRRRESSTSITRLLAHKSWGPKEWDSTYTDLPNRLVRVVVSDRSKFKTTDQERKLVEPKGLQERIDGLMVKYMEGRAFVRASGTEEAVRVYAEAGTRSEADELAFKVAELLAGY